MEGTRNRQRDVPRAIALGMVSVLFDTNILIDYLKGVRQARTELERYSDRAISLITWMEVMVEASPETEEATRHFLNSFINLPIDDQVSSVAVMLRKNYKIKLPDAIVWATAQVNKRIFVTRNTRDFLPDEPGIHIPYQL